MRPANLFTLFTERLERAGIRYVVAGSVAGIVYGEPRLTHDVDLVVELPRHAVANLLQQFPLEEFYAPPEEVVLVECRRSERGHFNIIHHETGFEADVYL